ncbi:WGR domain-containing protein [Mesorhizobium sp.]|uniref:WGR domain-containing protein n=1 Tax=Mesorhizobium sp. TaxID=1871066 RepID=UPI00345D4B4A
MIEPKVQIVLERRDCTCNLARFYVLAVEPSLFGGAVLVRGWGSVWISMHRPMKPARSSRLGWRARPDAATRRSFPGSIASRSRQTVMRVRDESSRSVRT